MQGRLVPRVVGAPVRAWSALSLRRALLPSGGRPPCLGGCPTLMASCNQCSSPAATLGAALSKISLSVDDRTRSSSACRNTISSPEAHPSLLNPLLALALLRSCQNGGELARGLGTSLTGLGSPGSFVECQAGATAVQLCRWGWRWGPSLGGAHSWAKAAGLGSVSGRPPEQATALPGEPHCLCLRAVEDEQGLPSAIICPHTLYLAPGKGRA